MTTSFIKTDYYNMQHMYNIPDIVNTKEFNINVNSIFDFVYKNKNFSNFLSLIIKSGYENFLNDIEYTDITLFLPVNNGFRNFNINNINKSRAIEIVSNCILNNRIISEILQHSKFSNYITRNKSNKIFIEIDNNIVINKQIQIINTDINLKNGIIHIIDKPIIPYLI